MNPFKNFIVNLSAAGVAAVACIWILALTVLAVFAPETKTTANVLTGLQIFGGALAFTLMINRVS
jgi:hypothetical protein